MSEWGFVYCLANDSMPGIYKIGFTTRAPMNRVAELSAATGVPEPFYPFFYVETEDPARFEREIHRILNDFRVSENREFFRVDDRIARKAFYNLNDGRGYLIDLPGYEAFCEERDYLAAKAEKGRTNVPNRLFEGEYGRLD